MRADEAVAGDATGRRSYNERLILTLVRRRRALPKAELARLTGLSPTAVGGLVRRLEADGLVTRGAPRKGQIGQPFTPYSLARDGAWSLGLKVGRRTAEMALLDATMTARAVEETTYEHPTPAATLAFAERAAARLLDRPERRRRLAGLGVALPNELWSWSDEMNAPPGALEAWRGFDAARAFATALDAPVFAGNDATAACAAQLALDPPAAAEAGAPVDFAYFFVGWFIGGGVVLEGRLRAGRRGDAGAFGSMPVSIGAREPEQLIRSASLYRLEHDLRARGVSAEAMWAAGSDWSAFGAALEHWLERAATGVAQAAAAAAAVIDFDAVVVDGSFPAEIRARFTAAVREKFRRLDRRGLAPLEILEGTVGRNARAIGAGCLPLLERFAVEETAIAARDRTKTGRE